MAVITAFKCLSSGKIFETEKEYKKHRRAAAKEAKRKRIEIQTARRYDGWLKEFCSEFRPVDEMIGALKHHQNIVWAHLQTKTPHYRKGGSIPEILSFSVERMTWSECVSNSHSCPRGGSRNWGGMTEGAPRGYPGWKCRLSWKVRVQVKDSDYYRGSQFFEHFPVNTGTGGGGNGKKDCTDPKYLIQEYAYDAEIFAHDWPGPYKAQRLEHEIDNRIKAAKLVGFAGPFDRDSIKANIPKEWEPDPLPPLESYITLHSKRNQ